MLFISVTVPSNAASDGNFAADDDAATPLDFAPALQRKSTVDSTARLSFVCRENLH
jgi:hypothetical protein